MAQKAKEPDVGRVRWGDDEIMTTTTTDHRKAESKK